MKTWTPEEIREILYKYDDQVGKALVKLYERQTEDEQMTSTTKHSNGVGFSGADAEILSEFARSYMKYGSLTTKQLVLARKRIVKYTRQLCEIANAG